jgi:TonB-linked SusC/RagA family outer membrane protein
VLQIIDHLIQLSLKKRYYLSLIKFFTFTIVLLKCCSGFCQQKISGFVRDIDDKSPLTSASITIKGDNSGTSTDINGYFRLTARKGAILVFSYLGYTPKEVTVENDTILNIFLSKFVSPLNQIVVTGYTLQRVKEITGSVSVVNSADLTVVPDGDIEKMLQGKVAGLTVITSGLPGGQTNIRINGIGNFGDVAPLYIIDGVEGDVNLLNPSDIESLQVLKDAGAYAIYGVRGANGVILITTKQGKSGKTMVNFDAYVSLQEPLSKGPDLLNPQGQADYIWLALKNSHEVDANGNPSSTLYGNGPTPVLPDYIVNGYGYPANAPQVNPSLYNITPTAVNPIYQIMKFNKQGTDWFHELFRPAFTQNYSLNVSGGSDKNHYLVSLGYLDQHGTFLNTFFKKITLRVNTDFSVNDAIRFGENIQLFQGQSPPSSPDLYHALLSDPYFPVYDIEGNSSSGNGQRAGPADNPVTAQLLTKDDRFYQWQVFGNMFAEVDLLKHLTFRSSFGGGFHFSDSYSYTYGPYDPSQGLNVFNESTGYTRSLTWTNTLTLSEKFKGGHSLKLLIGTETKSDYGRSQIGTSKGYLTNDPNLRLLGNGNGVPTDQTINGMASNSFLSSFISRAEYGFNDKIYFTATLREDGSSIFGPENRFGWFPSVSAAWRITEENFMKKINWLTDLKLRASWGESGFNGNTTPLNQYTLYTGGPGSSYYDIFGTSNSTIKGYTTIQYGNAKTGWQKDIMTDVGFESILWKGKLSITTDWYKKKSTGLLFPAALPAILGYATPPYVNVGEVDNTGVNITLGSKGNFSKDWGWNANVAITTYQNKVVKLDNFPYLDDPVSYRGIGFAVRQEVGYPEGSFFGYKIIGIFQNAADVSSSPVQQAAQTGRFKYLDANHDGVINDKDRVHFGNPNPIFTTGITLGVSYKNLDLSTFSYWSCGNDVLNEPAYLRDVLSGSVKSPAALYDSWTPKNPNASIPIVENSINFSNSDAINSYPLEKGSYLRNKTLIVGYTLPAKILQKFKIIKIRLYAEAINLFTITQYKGLDPELSGTTSVFGIDGGNYPTNQRQYLIGVNLNF